MKHVEVEERMGNKKKKYKGVEDKKYRRVKMEIIKEKE